MERKRKEFYLKFFNYLIFYNVRLFYKLFDLIFYYISLN